MKISDGTKFLFIGDSITDYGRRGASYPLGNGYVRIFADKLMARRPELGVDFINKGIDGNTIKDLSERWEDDVIALEPDWLSIKIGVNDCNRTLLATPQQVSPAEFRATYDELLTRTCAAGECGIVLIDPFFISRDTSGVGYRSKMLQLLPEYIQVVHDMAEKYGARLLKTHDLFQQQLSYHDADTLCPEPVHPNQTGHTMIAEALYDILSDCL